MEELLPAELTIDILSRLPVKTIIYCKCVCKKWRNLLLESSFVHLHLSRSAKGIIIHHKHPTIDSNVSNNPGISIDWNESTDPGILGWVEIEEKDDYHHLHHDPLMNLDLNLAPIVQKSEINLKGSVNGLICLSQNHLNHDNIYICNPVTREYMILPRRQQYDNKGEGRVNYGFGMSSMTGEYKVIRTFQSYKNQCVSEAQVYTLGTGQWRSLVPLPYKFYGDYGSFLNGHCHWIVISEEDSLCTFDFDKETFQLFPSTPPPHVEEEAIQGSKYHVECLAILKGCLCKMDSYDFQFTILVMKEYGIKESWHKELVINQAICPHLHWPLLEPVCLIEGLNDGSILMLSEWRLWSFYPNNKTIQDTGLFEFFFLVNGMAYRPSFVKLQNLESERVHMF